MPLDMGLATVIGAGINAGGSLFSNSASAKQASKQMNFQRWMSNTAYKRAVRDMKRAGLNPVLAAGQPASTPTGAMGNVQNLGESLGRGVQSAVAYNSAKSQIRRTDAEAGILEAQQVIDKAVVDELEKNPDKKQAVIDGKITQEALGRSWIGSLASGWNSAKRFGTKKLMNRMEPRWEAQSAKQYQKQAQRDRQWRQNWEEQRKLDREHEIDRAWKERRNNSKMYLDPETGRSVPIMNINGEDMYPDKDGVLRKVRK